MFNVGPQEMLVLVLVGVIVFGPDKLPAIARQAGQMLRALRDLSDNARKQISELSPELGEHLGDLSALRKNGAGGLSASSALQKMLFDGDDDPLGMKAHARGDVPPTAADGPPAPSAEGASGALSLAKQHDPAKVAGAAVPIPDAAPAHLAAGPGAGDAASGGAVSDDAASGGAASGAPRSDELHTEPLAAEPELTAAPMSGPAQQQRRAAPGFDDVT